ncbi:hypothetical protein DFQ11_1153 [Winogradskyella epiphytica]|uniref:Uncharacterized protein n=1 Tax=Winogradskyella epiphytica TaxID=262005 RepID=A0A2V4WT47_9FLAO|nr:hypothetical protein [Winogradskyella epiphytica]PYE78998.1 hypothetical protein DFQ11_1153 [Winogradskyella epiphytica]GGW74681.1 hypothetical protein GCM10008085_28450 [Winogradskyella epiphytica]
MEFGLVYTEVEKLKSFESQNIQVIYCLLRDNGHIIFQTAKLQSKSVDISGKHFYFSISAGQKSEAKEME